MAATTANSAIINGSSVTTIVKLLKPDGAGHMERIFEEYSISESGSPNGSPSAAALLPAYLTNDAFTEVVSALTTISPGISKLGDSHFLFSVSLNILFIYSYYL
jgi:hypothetical protein